MTEQLTIGENTLAYDLSGHGPLVFLAHGIGDSRQSYGFLAPALAAAGYRVANLDVRGCGDSSLGWDGYRRTDIAHDLLAVLRQLGGPAVVIGHSISGGAATIAAAAAPDLVSGLVELAPFTRRQPFDLTGLLRVSRYRTAYARLARVMINGSLPSWMSYLDLAIPVKPADWAADLAHVEAKLSEPGRMKVLQAMVKANPEDAGAQLANVSCPVLIVEGGADPDWPDPRAEGERILADLPAGLGELRVIEDGGHYLHRQTPDELFALILPFLARTLPRA